MSALKTVSPASGGLTAPRGFACSSAGAAIKHKGRHDMALLVSDQPCSAAGVFTTNALRAHCVEWNAARVPSKGIRAILVNSGNANACTGPVGWEHTEQLAAKTGIFCDVPLDSVLLSATGVIGHLLPIDRMIDALPELATTVAPTPKAGTAFARAIMTTDTVKKECAVQVQTDDGAYAVGGCAKGSGMIHPNMATMLGFVTTDAAIAPASLQTILKRVADKTFNNLTIDGDTSTNDMLLVLASGASGVRLSTKELRTQFEAALFEVCNDLCAQLAADGEGATKRIQVTVRGGKTYADARLAAKAIAGSNLVKTAVFGNDPNWGRIACAIGYSGARFSPDKMHIALGDIPVCIGLKPWDYNEGQMKSTLRKNVVEINVDLGLGTHTALAHTCDLTYDYVKINAEYTT